MLHFCSARALSSSSITGLLEAFNTSLVQFWILSSSPSSRLGTPSLEAPASLNFAVGVPRGLLTALARGEAGASRTARSQAGAWEREAKIGESRSFLASAVRLRRMQSHQ